MDLVAIANRAIGIGHPPLVIAEIGVNHDGSLPRALELVQHAREAGADAVKLQIFSARTLMHASSAFAGYQQERVSAASPVEMLEACELTARDFRQIVSAIQQAGLIPLATAFSLQDVETVRELDLPAIKVASPDLVNYPLLQRIARLNKPVILSTGAASMDEVEQAVGWMRSWRAPFALLHCVSSYPTALESANLGWIGELARFGAPVGYSDHTTELLAGALAVAAGATIVEKHLTYDRSAAGPDHWASADPAEFATYVTNIRRAAALRGRPGKQVLDIEQDVRRVSRQSIVARGDLGAGHVIGEEDLTVQRPGTGIGAAYWNDIVGRRTARAVKGGSLLGWDDLEK